MSLLPFKTNKVEPHLQLLGTLFLLLQKIRKEGLMSIESDIEPPEKSSAFDIVAYEKSKNVYAALCDTLRMMAGGNLNPEEMNDYMGAYGKTAGLNSSQESQFEVMRLTLVAWLRGYAPQVAVEFGRQGIPFEIKPSFLELEDFLKELRNSEGGTLKRPEDVERALERFYESLETEE